MTEFLPGYDINSLDGICGPAGLPAPVIEKLNALAKQVLGSGDVKSAYLRNCVTPLYMNVAEVVGSIAARRGEADASHFVFEQLDSQLVPLEAPSAFVHNHFGSTTDGRTA